jgi:peptide subunit release factor 1 (eRF1)
VITKPDIEEIARRKPVPGSPVLSVYLDIDQSKASNLDRRFEAALKNMLRSIEERLDETQSNHFSADAKRVRQYVSDLEPRAKGLIVFCDESENFFWSREIKAPIKNNARWNETPYVLPLLQLLDEHERYGVVLVDKAYARLFTVFMGDIQEHYEALAPAPVSHVKSTGTDHMLSEDRFQHKAAMHVHWHLKDVAEKLEKLFAQYGFDRLLLAGPVEATAELQRLLPKRIRSRIVERLSLPAQRVWRLIYADGFSPRGGQCANCAMLFARTDGACDYCGGAIKPLDDLLEAIMERLMQQDANIESVAGDAANRL